jgi:ribosomal protein L12E/L44/L45/RPP1/RPP2
MHMAEKTSSDDKWRKLCEMISVEADPHRLSELVNQLVKELDARREAIRQEENKGQME